MVEQLAQVSLGLPVGRVRPEKESNLLARLGLFGVEEKVGEQRLLPAAKAGQRCIIIS